MSFISETVKPVGACHQSIECGQLPNTIVVIGAGSAKGQDYLAAMLERSKTTKIVAVVVNKTIPDQVQKWAVEHQWKVIRDGNIQKLVETVDFDTAIVSLPHDQHAYVTRKLLELGKYIIKEKPLGMDVQEVSYYQSCIQQRKCLPIFTTLQRSTHPLFLQARADLPLIGKLQTFTYTYAFNLPNQTSGWRADPAKSGGGVVLDMGYHAIDVLVQFFGSPLSVQSNFGYAYSDMMKNGLEDRAEIRMCYPEFSGTLILDRHASKKEEWFTIKASKGSIRLSPTSYELYLGESCVKRVELTLSKTEIIQKMLDVCLAKGSDQKDQFERNMQTMSLIEVIYAQKRLQKTLL